MDPEECDKPYVGVEPQEGEERAPELSLCSRGPATDRYHKQLYELGTSNRA